MNEAFDQLTADDPNHCDGSTDILGAKIVSSILQLELVLGSKCWHGLATRTAVLLTLVTTHATAPDCVFSSGNVGNMGDFPFEKMAMKSVPDVI